MTYIDANNLDLDAIFEMPVGASPDASAFHEFLATADQGLLLKLLSLRGYQFLMGLTGVVSRFVEFCQ